ncbi:hypothetical protein DdX_12804 [Ditylenchus destructor]|uniref:Uncharacterized protein n=1 Tax=Ditylenchus destructor TaxID=166010 RepID=A0AAD4MUZ3_9BILA|nr:hypothetical protein DdX_12804 [Ditylenchus destructor]
MANKLAVGLFVLAFSLAVLIEDSDERNIQIFTGVPNEKPTKRWDEKSLSDKKNTISELLERIGDQTNDNIGVHAADEKGNPDPSNLDLRNDTVSVQKIEEVLNGVYKHVLILFKTKELEERRHISLQQKSNIGDPGPNARGPGPKIKV